MEDPANLDDAADDDEGAASNTPSNDDGPGPTDDEHPGEHIKPQVSSLAENILVGPSRFAPCYPFRRETGACLPRCMLDGTTPLGWVLQMVMPESTRPVDVPRTAQFGEARGVCLNVAKTNSRRSFQGATNSQTDAAIPIQLPSSSDGSSHSLLPP